MRARFPALLAEARAGHAGGEGRDGPPDLRVLCLHQCVEGATCGPAGFTFRHGPDVIRRADLPPDAAAVLCGHVHRHQVLPGRGGPPVVYAGSTERTSSAEAGERKVALVLTLSRAGLEGVERLPLPDRPAPAPRAAWRRAGPAVRPAAPRPPGPSATLPHRAWSSSSS